MKLYPKIFLVFTIQIILEKRQCNLQNGLINAPVWSKTLSAKMLHFKISGKRVFINTKK